MLELKLLLLLFAANSAPVIALHLLLSRSNYPVDNGCLLADGKPLFGPSKTWRGIISALILTSLAAWLCNFSFTFGLLFGASVMAGDLLANFIKRRLGRPSSS